MQIMATDGGAHPPEKWAAVTANSIIEISETAPGALLADARAFRTKVEAILVGHHRLAQEHERAALKTEGSDRLATDIDAGAHAPDAVDDIIAASRGTSFAEHFAKPETRVYLDRLLHEHFHHSMYIERSYHADTNPDNPLSKTFHAVAANGHALLPLHDDDLEQHGGREQVARVLEANHLSFIAPGDRPVAAAAGEA